MDTADLAIFVRAAVGGSLSEAARRLGLTPAAASRGLQRLEAQLGVRLVHRSTRSFALASDGEAYLPHAKAMLDVEDAAARSIAGKSPTGVSGLLRLTAPATFGRKIVAPMLGPLLTAHPDLTIDLQLTDSVVDVVAAGLDLAVRIAPPLRSSNLIARRIASNPLVICAAPSYLARVGRPRYLEDLALHECLALGGAATWVLSAEGRRRQVRVRGRVASNSNEALREACIAGLGLGLHSTWDIRDEIGSGELQEIVLEDTAPNPALTIWAVTPSARPIPLRVSLFVTALRRSLQTGSPTGSSRTP